MFRRRSNGRGFRRQNNNNDNKRLIVGSFSNARVNNNFKSHQSVEKLLERYKILAKEALSSGDKTLSENYQVFWLVTQLYLFLFLQDTCTLELIYVCGKEIFDLDLKKLLLSLECVQDRFLNQKVAGTPLQLDPLY